MKHYTLQIKHAERRGAVTVAKAVLASHRGRRVDVSRLLLKDLMTLAAAWVKSGRENQ
jgi:hypothetical protein